MKNKESVNLYRVLSIVVMVLVTLGITALMCVQSHLYMDEWLCMLFFAVIFILIYIYEMEYERRQREISKNPQTNFIRLAIVYTVCCLLAWGMSFLPEFFRPVMLIPMLICAVANPIMAMTVGIFLNILMSLMVGGSFYALVCYIIMTMLGAVLSRALREKKYRIWIAFLLFFLNIMLPDVLYYMSCREIHARIFLYGAIDGAITALAACFVYGRIARHAEEEVANRLLDIVSMDYSEVKALKDFSMAEYRHASKVSSMAYRCGEQMGYRANLCLAAGFYYRMGQWLGEPYIQNGVDKAYSLCFPMEVITILSEYYGQERLPSTPESALVHMVDALVIKAEAMEQDISGSQWNSNILIYQTLNEFSESGIYDRSGMSMNQFLKLRDILTKEELLK